MVTVTLLASLPACSLLIPENPSTPRYNSVLGAPRAPELNPAAARSMSPTSSAAPANAPSFPPVDPATEARAAQIMAAQSAAPTESVAVSDLGSARQRPSENGQPMMVAGNYPDLHSVPPKPTDNAQARLDKVRAELEAERTGADNARAKLSSDAAAEPSLIGTVPPPEPVNVAPVAPPPGTGPQSSGYIALPPPPPPLASSAGTPWDRSAPPQIASAPIGGVAPALSANAAMEPIILRPPAGMASAQASPFTRPAAAPMAAQPAMAPALSGGFNPMADAAPSLRAPTSYASGYLPPSRYTTRRN
jgi:hypothetical protein